MSEYHVNLELHGITPPLLFVYYFDSLPEMMYIGDLNKHVLRGYTS